MPISAQLASTAAWVLLPRTFASLVQSAGYTLVGASAARRRPGTPQFARDRRMAAAVVVLVYTGYTLYNAVSSTIFTQGNFYAVLGLPAADADARAIKHVFRQRSVLLHPDKSRDPHDAAVYAALQAVVDTLTAPVTRFAYDRFGQAALQWQGCVTEANYVVRGIMGEMVPEYAISFVVSCMLAFAGIGFPIYWRVCIVFSQFAAELYLLTHVEAQTFITANLSALYPLTVHDVISLGRRVIPTLAVACAQLAGLLSGASAPDVGTLVAEIEKNPATRAELSRRFAQTVQDIADETVTGLRAQLVPFVAKDTSGSTEKEKELLTEQLTDFLVTSRLLSASSEQSRSAATAVDS
ncbi:uncharacterized protein V1518DRAFT_389952 [Limtongia smithiae]|uniref:uncharacterized protein n=1 Tax=Limtongia smithiae TaxID=1125753 RepID=UPI0034CDD6CC